MVIESSRRKKSHIFTDHYRKLTILATKNTFWSASVVRPEALLKVGGDAYLTLGRDGTALKKIGILHNCPPFAKASGDTLRSPKVFILWWKILLVIRSSGEIQERRMVEPIGIEPTTS